MTISVPSTPAAVVIDEGIDEVEKIGGGELGGVTAVEEDEGV